MKRHSTAFATLLLMVGVLFTGMGQSRQTVFSDSGEDTSTGLNLRNIVIKLDTNVYHLWNQAFTNLPAATNFATTNFYTKLDASGGTATNLTISGATASRTLVTDGSGNITSSSISSTALGTLAGIDTGTTIQAQLDLMLPASGGSASSLSIAGASAERVMVNDVSGYITNSAILVTELETLDGIDTGTTVQGQIDDKPETLALLSDVDYSALSTSAARITMWLDYTNSLQINYPSQVWVDGISDLQSIDPDVMRNDVAIVRDPDRGGIFRRVLTSGVTTNTGTVFASSANSAWSWERQGVDEYDIRWFGASLGSANASATTEAFQDAIDTAFNNGGGTVLVPPCLGDDYFFLDDTVTIKYRVHLRGSGVAFGLMDRSTITNRVRGFGPSAIKAVAALNKPMFTGDNVNGYIREQDATAADGTIYTSRFLSTSIRGIVFHGNAENQTESDADILFFKDNWGIEIADCGFFDAGGYQIRARNCNELQVTGSFFRNAYGHGVMLDDCSDSVLAHNQIGGSVGPTVQLLSRFAWLNTISDNMIWNSQDGTTRWTFTVDTGADEITMSSHPFQTGDPVFFTEYGGGTLPAGLTKTNTFYAIRADANTLQVSGNYGGAFAATNIVDITDAGSGTFEGGFGPAVGLYLIEAQGNLISNNRIDQHHEEGIRMNHARNNVFANNMVLDNSYDNAENWSSITFENYSSGNEIRGGFVGQFSDDNLGGGLNIDSTSYNNRSEGVNFRGSMPLWSVGNITNAVERQKIFVPWTAFEPNPFAANQPVKISTASGRQMCYSFTNGVDTFLGTQLHIPEDWQLFQIQGEFVNPQAGTGNVYWQLLTTTAGNGETLNTTDRTYNEAVASTTQYLRSVHTFGTEYTNEWNFLQLRVQRFGSVTNIDTKGANQGFLGVNLIRTK